MNKSFGVMYTLMIVLMIPAFSYYIPGFDPLWLRFFPTYPMLQAFKETLLINGNLSYAGYTALISLGGGLVVFLLANLRFKKTLTV